MAYCFRALDILDEIGRTRAGVQYARASTSLPHVTR
jgi:hypothetical protein